MSGLEKMLKEQVEFSKKAIEIGDETVSTSKR